MMPQWGMPTGCSVDWLRMNVAFFLTPKHEVLWVPEGATIAEALARMEPHRHSAVPLLDHDGRYVGTLTEGDLLWHLRRASGPWSEVAASTSVATLDRWMKNDPIPIGSEMETLFARAVVQSFVPVVDDREIFVGIVRRKSIVEYCVAHAQRGSAQSAPPKNEEPARLKDCVARPVR